MSVRSENTAVTWAKPFRENDQVRSRPGLPDSATSIGKVTCFSTSSGDSAGAKALTWTWTLVMSGTASIGSTVTAQAPDNAAANVNNSTYQRRRTEKASTHSIMVRAPAKIEHVSTKLNARLCTARPRESGDPGPQAQDSATIRPLDSRVRGTERIGICGSIPQSSANDFMNSALSAKVLLTATISPTRTPDRISMSRSSL